jgi:hypothetical protein
MSEEPAAPPFRYQPYHLLDGRPNVIVDGSPCDGTVLSLSHWPRLPAPPGLARDTSAEIAFAYLDAGAAQHGTAALVSNNHFDQDGLVSVFVLVQPAEAARRRSLLVDVATAGDFGRYRDRAAARISMTLAAYADPERSPLQLPDDYPERCGLLYDELLRELPRLCDDIGSEHKLWADEDDALTRSELAIRAGAVHIEEDAALELAVVDLPTGFDELGGHRFGSGWSPYIQPMAVYNATPCNAVLYRRGSTYRFVYRYESWVQFASAPVRRRRDLTALARALTEAERGDATWSFSGVSDIEPTLTHDRPSSLAPDDVRARIRAAIEQLPGAWDPVGYPMTG